MTFKLPEDIMQRVERGEFDEPFTAQDFEIVRFERGNPTGRKPEKQHPWRRSIVSDEFKDAKADVDREKLKLQRKIAYILGE